MPKGVYRQKRGKRYGRPPGSRDRAPRRVSPKSIEALKPHHFPPGVSGNPGGRPKSNRAIVEVARDEAVDAMKVLGDVMRDADAPPSSRVSAAIAVLERAHGKPTQDVNLRRKRDITEYDDDELAALAGEGNPPDEGESRGAPGAGPTAPGSDAVN